MGIRRRTQLDPWLAYLVLGAAAIGLYFALPWDSNAQLALYDAIGVASAVVIAAAVFMHRPAVRAPWFLFAAGQLAFAVGDMLFNFYNASTPSTADVFYLAGYPLIAAGLAIFIFRLRSVERRAGLLDAAIFTVGFALVQWVFLMDKLVHEPGSRLQTAVALSYPAMDVVLLSALVVFFLTPAWRTVAYRFIAASLVLLLVADEIYGISPDSYASTTPLDACWLGSYVLWGVAALHPSMTALSRPGAARWVRLGAPRLALLGGGLMTAPVVLLIERTTGRPLDAVAIVIGAALLSFLVLARLGGAIHTLDRVNERLREADRLKDEFVALISHDLRTPLTSIIGYTELAREDPRLHDELRSYLDVVERNSDRLLQLVNDLLFVARLEAGQLQLSRDELDVAAIARQSAHEAQPRAAAKNIVLTCDAPSSALVAGDKGRMFQLFDNLISNAIKFTPEHGRVDVRVADEGRDGGVRIDVADTGIGIEPEEQTLLFERFFRATTARTREIPGTGLGLYIARAIVDAHGGTIDVASQAGAGTTFSIVLPAARALAA